MPDKRGEKTVMWLSKELRDRLGARVHWKQSLADVVEELLEHVEACPLVSDTADKQPPKPAASDRVLVEAR